MGYGHGTGASDGGAPGGKSYLTPPLTGSGRSSAYSLPPLTSPGRAYGAPSIAPNRSKPGKGGGVLGSIEHAAVGVGLIPYEVGKMAVHDTAANLALLGHPGVFLHGRRQDVPRSQLYHDIVLPYAKQEAHNYAPLVRGNVGQFLHQVRAEPLNYAMDAATLLSGGGAAVGRGGELAARLGVVGKESRLANLRSASLTESNPALQAGERTKGRIFMNPAARDAYNVVKEGGTRRLVPKYEGAPPLTKAEELGTAGPATPHALVKAVERNPVARMRQMAIHVAARRLSQAPELLGGAFQGTKAGEALQKTATGRRAALALRAARNTPLGDALHSGANTFGENALYGRAIRRATFHDSYVQKAWGQRFETAVSKLNKWQRVAWHYHMDGTVPEAEAARLRAAVPDHATNPDMQIVDAAIRRAENPKLIKAYNEITAKPDGQLARAVNEGRALSQQMRDERIAAGEITPEQAEARDFLHARIASGAQFETVPGETKGLHGARVQQNQRQRAYDRVAEKVAKAQQDTIAREAKRYMPGERKPGPQLYRPRSAEDAQKRFDTLDKQYNDFIDSVAKTYGHPEYGTSLGSKEARRETASRNVRNAKFNRQQADRTRSGGLSSSRGAKISRRQPTLSEEVRQHAEQLVQNMIATSTHPDIKRLGELIAERDQLAAQLGEHKLQQLGGATGEPPANFGAEPIPPRERPVVKPREGEPSTPEDFAAIPYGSKVLTYDNRLLTPAHAAELQRQGGALSIANDRLQQMERRHLVNVGHDPKVVDRMTSAERTALLPEHGAKTQHVLRGGKSIDELKAEGLRASYVPDMTKRAVPNALAARGLGMGVPAADQALKQNLGHIFTSGALWRDPKALTVGHLRMVRRTLATSIHQALLRSGKIVDRNYKLQGDEQFIREDASTKIHELQKTSGETMKEMLRFGDLETPIQFTTRDPALALAKNDRYVVVSKTLANQLTGEFTRTNTAIAALWKYPTKVWRSIILGLRPGFFTNNVIGNYLMLSLQHHGLDAGQAYVSMLREMKQTGALRKLQADPEFRRIAKQTMPEMYVGTHAASAFEGLPGIGRLGQFRHGIGPVTAKVSEQVPRELIGRVHVIREAKRLGREIPKQVDDFNALSAEMLRRPGVAQRAVDDANRTLGDYLHYNTFETGLRNIVPFYGWLRAITGVTLRMAANTPGRTALAAKIAQILIDENNSKYGPLPDSLLGMIPFGGKPGQMVGLSTRGLNPFASISDEAKALDLITGGSPGQGAQALSALGVVPFLQGTYEWASGKSMYSGAKLKPLPGPLGWGLPGYLVGSTVTGLPQYGLFKSLVTGKPPYKSKMYVQPKGRWGNAQQQLLQNLGVPVKTVNLPAAHGNAIRYPNG